jgi:hypothetical protein
MKLCDARGSAHANQAWAALGYHIGRRALLRVAAGGRLREGVSQEGVVMDGRSSQPNSPRSEPDRSAAAEEPDDRRGAAGDHLVQFYESDKFLAATAAQYLTAGLERGEPLIVIATPAHRAALCDALRSSGLDTERAVTGGRLVLLDAEETLARIMVGSMPDWELFRRTIGDVIDRCVAAMPAPRVRAYGEMVDLLWRSGNARAAVRLEEMWNELQTGRAFSLLCAYLLGGFLKEAGDLSPLCATHTHVLARVVARSTPYRGGAAPHRRARRADVQAGGVGHSC